jgi:hypothetical protein
MAVSLLQLQDQITIVIGEDHDPRLSPTEIANEAGRYLISMHSWNWRKRPPVTLDLIADQSHVILPDDFGYEGEIIGLTMADNVTYGITLTGLEDVAFKRSTTILSPSFYFVALAEPMQQDMESPADPRRLEIYPTPTGTTPGSMNLIYRAGWVNLVNAESVANISVTFDDLLKQLARAFAWYYATNDRRMIEEIEVSSQLKRLKRGDGSSQSNLGPIQGGILGQGRTTRTNWNFSTTGPA